MSSAHNQVRMCEEALPGFGSRRLQAFLIPKEVVCRGVQKSTVHQSIDVALAV